MSHDELSCVPDLDDKQRGVLADKLAITSCYELILADRDIVVQAFGRRTCRPTHEEVARWQDDARRSYAEAISARRPATPSAGWNQIAMFVVAFEQRDHGHGEEHRIIAEQTEVEPEAEPVQRAEWASWMSEDVSRWMAERVGLPVPSSRTDRTTDAALSTGAPGEGSDATPGRPRLDVERMTLADAAGHVDLVRDSQLLAHVRDTWDQPTRLVLTLGAANAGPDTSVLLQLAGAAGPKKIVAAELDDRGRIAECELVGLPVGEYRPTVVVSKRDGSSLPFVLRLPTVDVVRASSEPAASP